MPTRKLAVMGIVNVTPDSFSDGGRFLDPDRAVQHALRLVDAGADVIDVGGESTRPGAASVDVDEELRRIVPVIGRLADRIDVAISVDTTKARVALAAIEAGASMVNDVSAGRFDPEMLGVVAASGAAYVVMHMRGEPRTMQQLAVYDDVVGEVTEFLVERLDAAREAGVRAEGLWADPGIGFGKTAEHNMRLLADLDRLVAEVDAPVLVGTSRKSFLGSLLDLGVDEREEATLATTVWAFEKGAAMVRVHDVASAVSAVRVLDVMERATPDGLEPVPVAGVVTP